MEVSDTPNFSDIPMLNISSLKETNTTNLQVIHGGGCGSVGNEKKKKPRTGSEDNDHYKTSPPAAAIEELPNSSIYDPPEAEIKPQDWFNDSSPDTSNTDANPSPQKEAKLPDTMESPDPNSETGGKAPHPPKKPSETGEEDPDDYLEILDSRLSARNILLHRPLTRRFILGATRLLLYESEANAEVLASRIFDTMNNSITWLHARQGKMLDALGLNSVALSLMVKGCLFCFGDKAGTAHLRGPAMMTHIRQHFRGNIAEEVDIRDEEFMDIVVDSFPGDLETPEQRRTLLRRIRNFLINDLQNACHHCGETFEFDYKWRWSGRYKSYDFTALMNTHRYWRPVAERLGSDGYLAKLNALDYENKTIRMLHELKHARLSEMDQERINMFRIYTRALVGQGRAHKREGRDNRGTGNGGSDADDEDDIDSDFAFDFGPEDDPPLQDDVAVPIPRAQEKASKSSWPRHFLPALDNPILVLQALEHNRGDMPLPKFHWSDDDLLNFLADRDVRIKACGALTRRRVLEMSDDLLCHGSYTDWIRWMFPIPDRVDHDEKAEFTPDDLGSTVLTHVDNRNVTKQPPKHCPLLSAHFLLRYDMDKTNTLRCHTYQNLECFWNLLGFEAYHPPDESARTQLRRIGKEPDGEAASLGWDTDDLSPIPAFVSRVLRHLRIIGFAWEAELTYFILGKHVVLPEQRSVMLQWHVNRWRRIVEWQLGDELLHAIIRNYLECNLPDDSEELEAPRDRMLELLNVSPFDESEDAGIVDEAHEMWFSLQAQERILDEGDKNPVVIDPYRRQPAKDQYRVGLGGYKCYRDEVKRNLKKTKEVKPKDTVPEPEPAGGSTPPPSEEKKSFLKRITSFFIGGEDSEISQTPQPNDSTVVAYFCTPGDPDNTGIPLSASLELTDEMLGLQGHWYFWWFPSTIPPPEPTPDIPVMTATDRKSLITRAHLQERYLQAVERFIIYLGLTWRPSKTPKIIAGKGDDVRWLVRDHHDHPRIARAIVSLGEMNQQHLANDLYNAVVKMTAGSEVDIERWRTAFEAIPEPQRYARIGGRQRQRPITISEERERASREGKRRRKWKVQFLAEDKGDKIEAQVNGDRKRAWNRKEEVSKPRKRARVEEVHQDTFNLGSSGKGTDECETEVHPNCSPPHEVNLPLLGPSEENMEDKSECYDAADAISPADKLEPIPAVPAEQEVEEEPTSSLSEVTTLSSLQPSSPPCLSTPIPHQPDGFPSSPFIEVVSQITIITHAASEPDLRNITGAGNVSSSPCGVGKEAMLEQRRRWKSVGW